MQKKDIRHEFQPPKSVLTLKLPPLYIKYLLEKWCYLRISKHLQVQCKQGLVLQTLLLVVMDFDGNILKAPPRTGTPLCWVLYTCIANLSHELLNV